MLSAGGNANAAELSVTAGGHKVHGIRVSPGVGYRSHGAASGTAVDGQPEGACMVADGTPVGSDCCFDHGNAESAPADTGSKSAFVTAPRRGPSPCTEAVRGWRPVPPRRNRPHPWGQLSSYSRQSRTTSGCAR
ncbi:hypothetical protein OG900_19170 [Streptomyces sp. NBC_00433]